jgi:hypothetical protein
MSLEWLSLEQKWILYEFSKFLEFLCIKNQFPYLILYFYFPLDCASFSVKHRGSSERVQDSGYHWTRPRVDSLKAEGRLCKTSQRRGIAHPGPFDRDSTTQIRPTLHWTGTRSGQLDPWSTIHIHWVCDLIATLWSNANDMDRASEEVSDLDRLFSNPRTPWRLQPHAAQAQTTCPPQYSLSLPLVNRRAHRSDQYTPPPFSGDAPISVRI